MFPIPWNRAFRKKDGTLVNMEDIGGGSSDLPEYSSEDAGKVLAVNDGGELAWVTVSGNSHYSRVSLNFDKTDSEGKVEEVE